MSRSDTFYPSSGATFERNDRLREAELDFRYLVRAIVRAAGPPDQVERSVLGNAARSWGLRPAHAAVLVREISENQTRPLPAPDEAERRERILKRAAQVALADGTIERDEHAYLKRLARNLDVSPEDLERFLDEGERAGAAERKQPAPPAAPEPTPRARTLGPISNDYQGGTAEYEPAEKLQRPHLIYSSLSPSGNRVDVRLYSFREGFDVRTGRTSQRLRYEDVETVQLGLNAGDDSCYCKILASGSPPVMITNLTQTGTCDYEYTNFLGVLHRKLHGCQTPPSYRVERPQNPWKRVGITASITLACALGAKLLPSLRSTTYRNDRDWVWVALIALVALGALGLLTTLVLAFRAIRYGSGDTYEPPDLPLAALPGASDLSIGEAALKGTGGIALGLLSVVAAASALDNVGANRGEGIGLEGFGWYGHYDDD